MVLYMEFRDSSFKVRDRRKEDHRSIGWGEQSQIGEILV